MGQKINPIGLRLGVNRTWDSRWFAGKAQYGKLLHEDMKIRELLMGALKQAAISKIVIERPHKKCRVNIHSARPGVVIGKKGADIDKLRKQVAKLTQSEVAINIVEVRKPEIDATLVADSIAQQLERRVAFRRAMKRAVQSAPRASASIARADSAALKSPASNGTARAACRCTLCAPTSTTASPRRTPLTARAASRFGSSRARSSSTIRWRRISAPPTPIIPRPTVRAASRASAIAPPAAMPREQPLKVHDHDAT
jgi:ribosomal protein S3